MKRILAVSAAFALTAASVLASPITLNFAVSSHTTGAKAVELVTFGSTVLPNPGHFSCNGFAPLPDPGVLEL